MPKSDDARKRLAELDAVLNALAHPARRQILMTVHFRGGEMTAGDIAARFRHSWPTTTRHLSVLAKAQLLTVTQDGRVRTYRTNPERLKLLKNWIRWFDR